MPSPPDIHRESEVTRLSKAIESAPDGLSIVAVSGPGGIGKTFLLEHVLASLEPDKLGYLTLRADASSPDARGDFFALVEGQLFRRTLDPPADRFKDYFPHLRALAAEHRRLVSTAVEEVVKTGAPEAVQKAAMAMLRYGRVLNRALPETRRLLDVRGLADADVEKAVDEAATLFKRVSALREATGLPSFVKNALGFTRRERVKRDLYALTAEEIRTDLSAALSGYEKRDLLRATLDRIPGLDRVLLVLDDYEAIQGVLEDFLTGALVHELARAPFRTVLVILGRDDLETTHAGWAQHCRRFLKDQIRLAPFDRAAALAVFADAGLPPERFDALYEATQGYPFLIHLAAEEASGEGGESIVLLRRFYDRTTRWMSERERQWFLRVCYLERVDEDTLRVLFPEEDVAPIQDWFEKEPSIRDPTAAFCRLRPMVRDKILRYLEVRAPKKHAEMVALAQAALR